MRTVPVRHGAVMVVVDLRRIVMRIWLLCLALLFPASALAGYNNLVNPGFDSNLAGWDNLFTRPAAWSGFDSNGNSLSGSALITNNVNPSSGGAVLVLSQCFPVLPGQHISYGGDMFIPSSAPEFSFTFIVLRLYTLPGCSDGLSDFTSVFSTDVGQWITATETVQAGPGIVSAAVFLGVSKAPGVTVDVSAWFDDIWLVLETLFEDGFEGP
jgi:hypothetical protein